MNERKYLGIKQGVLIFFIVTAVFMLCGVRTFAADYPEITSVEVTHKGVKFTWTPVEGAERYGLLYKSLNGEYKQIAGYTTDNFNYINYYYGAPADLYFAVRAVDSKYQQIGVVDETGYYYKLLDNVVIEQCIDNSNGILIKWKPVEGAASYRIFRNIASGEFVPYVEVSSDKTSYIDGGVKDGKNYGYKIVALRGDNGSSVYAESEYSKYTKTTQAQYTVTYDQKEARKQLKMINKFRTGKEAWAYNRSGKKDYATYKNLRKLKWDYKLEKVAILRASEVAYKFAHQRPNGKTCFSAADEVGDIDYNGENIAYASWRVGSGYLINMWKETNCSYSNQGHRKNMLGRGYIGFASAIVRVNGYTFGVQEFSRTDSFGKKTKANNKTKTAKVNTRFDYARSRNRTIPGTKVEFKTVEPGAAKVSSASYDGTNLILNWNRASLADGYYVYISSSKKGKFIKKKTVKDGDTVGTSIPGYKQGDTVFIKVVAYRKNYNKKIILPKNTRTYKYTIG